MRLVQLLLAAALLLGASVGDAAPVPSRRAIVAAPLRASSSLPACTAGDGCVLDCFATSSSWECRKADGTSVSVAQGTGTSYVSTPFGWAAYIPSHAAAPTIASADMETLLGGNSATFYDAGYSTFTLAAPGTTSSTDVIPFAHLTSAVGGTLQYDRPTQTYCTHYVNGTQLDTVVTAALGAWRAQICSVSSGGVQVNRTAATEATGTNATAPSQVNAAAYFGSNSSGLYYLRGLLARVRLYNRALSSTERARLEAEALGGVAGPAGLVTTTRASTGWIEGTDGNVYPVIANMPRIRSDYGLLIERASTNYWLNSTSVSTGKVANGTPAVVADVAAGPLSPVHGIVSEADRLTDDDAGAQEGYYATTPAATGRWSFSCYLKADSQTKAQAWLQTGTGTGNLSCNWTLTSSWARYFCTTNLTGTTGNVLGGLVVGHVAADTGSVLVSHCQLETDATTYAGPTSPIVAGGTATQRSTESVLLTGVTSGLPRSNATICATVRWADPLAWITAGGYGAFAWDTCGASSTPPGVQLWLPISTGGWFFDGRRSNSFAVAASSAEDTDVRLCSRYGEGRIYARVNSATETTGGSIATTLAEGHTQIRLGSYGTAMDHLNGYIRDFTVSY